MGITKRTFGHIKSLLHFDYPYFAEPNEGMRDEIGILTWTNSGTAKFVGTEIPVAQSVAGTPKFGYRCLQAPEEADYIESSTSSELFSFSANNSHEIEFFIRRYAEAEGTILKILDLESGEAPFVISLDETGHIVVNCSDLAISAATTSTALTLETWTHVKIRLHNETLAIILDGIIDYQGSYSGSLSCTFAKLRLGGVQAQIDEFVLRDAVSVDTVPTRPYAGTINLFGIGGNGKQGALNLTSGTTNINTSAKITSIASLRKFAVDYTINNNALSIFGEFGVGDEVLIMKTLIATYTVDDAAKTYDNGLYCLRKVEAVSGTTITLDRDVTEFSFTNGEATGTEYTYAIYGVPNFTSVVIGASATVSPLGSYVNPYGGLVVFRSKGDVQIEGKIITSTKGYLRKDWYQMTHNHLPERFIMNRGGGIIILSEGTVSASAAARIGATWDGSAKGGAKRTGRGVSGYNAGAGYGGSGSCDGDGPSGNTTSGAGGVGGGGGGSDNSYNYGTKRGYSAGEGGTGGCTWHQTSMGSGGTQGTVGRVAGARGYNNECAGGALGCAAGNMTTSGANVLIICKKLSAAAASISTGGAGGQGGATGGRGGGGTGMCYLAYEEAE